jgi:DNA-binding NarL/FixJ family response regulator
MDNTMQRLPCINYIARSGACGSGAAPAHGIGMPADIRVLLVDDHAIARNGARQMLGAGEDLCVAGEAADAAEAMALLAAESFDVALVDITLPGKNGLDLLKDMRRGWPAMAVLMLSTYSEDIYAVRALKLGAAGYLSKDVQTAVLVNAVRKAAAGGRYVSAALADRLAGLAGAGHARLSNRELEVLKLLVAGHSLVCIGALLQLAPNTVTTYRTRILEKMAFDSNAELTRYALEHGIL